MADIYVVVKLSNICSDHSNSCMYHQYFKSKNDARNFITKLVDDDYSNKSFYECISDDGIVDRRWSDYTEGIYFTLYGKPRGVEYQVKTLHSTEELA